VKLAILNPHLATQAFPPLHRALTEPNGLLAVGGCLSTTRLLNAYRHGIFPWFNADEPILWWSPNPRCVLWPQQVKISRRLARTVASGKFIFTIDQAFSQVIEACSQPRAYTKQTWISTKIKHAYTALHKANIAHSAEIWQDGELVGGVYGVALGQVFFGESMFHRKTDASKVALVLLMQQLQAWNYQLLDCQVYSAHLASLGAIELEREKFTDLLKHYCSLPAADCAWTS
jgi:leucyl/phenylalanyl-tRNA--protein transferase